MIFQLSDWFPKPMIWAIIVKFDQIRKKLMANFLCWNFGGRKNFFRGVVAKENVTIWGGRKKIWMAISGYWTAWKFTKTVILIVQESSS